MVILRIDFNSKIGLGHLKRQEAFIKKWRMKNRKFIIVCKECNEKLTKLPVIKIKNEEEFFEIVKKLNPKEVIVDNYNFTIEYEKKFKKLFPNIKLIVFDDTYENHFCDIVINHNIYAKKEKYKNKVPKFTKIICDGPYLREEFYIEKNKKYPNKNQVLIAIGGADNKNLTPKIIEILREFEFKITVLTTTANKNLNTLKKIYNIELHINSNNVAKLMKQSTLIITTPSVLLNEVYFLNKDFIAIKTAENQKEMINFLKEKNLDYLEKFDKEKLKNLIKKRIK